MRTSRWAFPNIAPNVLLARLSVLGDGSTFG
jgi:hypothetical protein